MKDWLTRAEWNAEKAYWREYEAAQHAKAGRSLVTEEEKATLSREEHQRKAYGRWMSLRFTGRAPELGWTIVGDVSSKQHKTIDRNGDPV